MQKKSPHLCILPGWGWMNSVGSCVAARSPQKHQNLALLHAQLHMSQVCGAEAPCLDAQDACEGSSVRMDSGSRAMSSAG